MDSNSSCVTVRLLRFACNDSAGEGRKCLPYRHLPYGLSRGSQICLSGYFTQGLYVVKCFDVVFWCFQFDNSHKIDDLLSQQLF